MGLFVQATRHDKHLLVCIKLHVYVIARRQFLTDKHGVFALRAGDLYRIRLSMDVGVHRNRGFYHVQSVVFKVVRLAAFLLK